MFKLNVILILALAVCVIAEPIRQTTFRRRTSARQQLQPTAAPVGYAPAGVTPSIPFELPTETEQPDVVYGPPEVEAEQPDTVYGPPPTENQQPDTVYGPPETEGQEPDSVYGPPETEAQEPDSVYGPPEAQTEQPDLVYGPPENDVQPDIDETTPEEAAKVDPSEEEVEEEAEDLDEVEAEVLVDEDGSIIAISTTFDQGNVDDKPARLVYQRFPQRRQQPTAVPARLTQSKIRTPSNFVYTRRYQSF